jgi:FlaA1/EpsC-like NDP-sugar epimerase
VVNAAALKQVPSCEYFPGEAVLTNCIGAHNIVRAIGENDYPVETVVAISTDKACKPVNVMGMTKSLQERIFVSANILQPQTRFIGVRYGNVLASRGSVIPLFHEQIRAGGPLTLTSPEMTRFLLTLDRAVDTVFEAMRAGHQGETLVPRLPSARVADVASSLIEGREIEVEVTGTRPGEKLHEILISEEEATRTTEGDRTLTIQPLLPELRREGGAGEPFDSREYSSADATLDPAGVSELLQESRLMIEDAPEFAV